MRPTIPFSVTKIGLDNSRNLGGSDHQTVIQEILYWSGNFGALRVTKLSHHRPLQRCRYPRTNILA